MISIIALNSCEKVIDMNIDEQEPKLVLISYLNPDSLIEVSVSKSVHILDYDSIIFVETAKVKVFENETLIEELSYNANSHSFRSNTVKPAIGKRYRIEASANGYKEVTAEVDIPIPVSITSIDTFPREYPDFNANWYGVRSSAGWFTVKLIFDDPVQDENFYIISILRKESYNPGKTTFYDNYKCSFSINSMLVEYSSLEQLLNFIAESDNSGLGGDNQENYIYASQIAFSDKAINGKQVSMQLNIDNGVDVDSIHFEIQLTSISKSYYRYVASEALYQDSGGPFTEKVQMYSNIKNGYGIIMGSSNAIKTMTRFRN